MPRARLTDHLILIAGCLFMLLPVLALVAGSTHDSLTVAREGVTLWPGAAGVSAYERVLFADDLFGNGVTALDMAVNSFAVALGIAFLKTVLSLLAAYALVCFRLPAAGFLFWLILLPMFFPIETRILPTFLVTERLGLLNSWTGMILPVVASGLGTLIFRQSLLHLPDELFEAARLDGAGPLRFLADIVVPLSVPVMTGLFALLFVLGWNQYLWPLMITTTSEAHYTLVRGIGRAGTGSNTGLALAVLALLPPGLAMLALQRWIARGLTGPLT